MVRKLDKIEKEMGYCEIKLEKERRLRKQVNYLRADVEALDRFMKIHGGVEGGIADLPFAKIAQQIAVEKQSRSRAGAHFRRSREDFVTAGILEIIRAERTTLLQEIAEIESKFESFNGFYTKRKTLQEEKKQALTSIAPRESSRVYKLDDEFKKTETLWNSLTEDALNLDEAVFFLSRNLDYLKSARSFLVAAKSSFDLEHWVESEYRGSLFRHSNVGRAKEMIEGANRNLKVAQKELVCVSSFKADLTGFETVLVFFLGALFDDIFLDERIERTIKVVEDTIATSEKRLVKTSRKRDQHHKRLERVERTRVNLFQRLGGERRGRVAVS